MKCDVISPKGDFADPCRQMQPTGHTGPLSQKGDAFVEDGAGHRRCQARGEQRAVMSDKVETLAQPGVLVTAGGKPSE